MRAERDGQPLALGSPQQRATLAVLLLRGGQPVRTPELIDALWGKRPPGQAEETVGTYIAGLREVLEPPDEAGPVITANATDATDADAGADAHAADTAYAARFRPEQLDAAVFEEHLAAAAAARAAGDVAGAYERLSVALRLWEGDTAAAGLPGPFLEAERERLGELRVAAREEALDCLLALGRHADAIAGLRTLTVEHPRRERPRALLMLALHRCGRQAEALAVFTEYRRVLARGHRRDAAPSAELARLYEQVLAGDPVLAAPLQPVVTAATAPAAPDLLPPDVAGFTGRERLTARVREALAGGNGGATAIVTLTGPGGAGKTALAVHAAHALRGDRPDGRLFLDLRGTDPSPVDTPTALAHFLHALGVAESTLPEGQERQLALYQSLLADRRMLLVLDNAYDTEQVLPLLPRGPGCAVLVTTRTPGLALPGAHVLEVGPMDRPDAAAMLAAVAGPGRLGGADGAVDDVLAACGGLPLALRVAGARLATDPAATPDELAGLLRDERHRLDALHLSEEDGEGAAEPVLRVGYEALAPEPARAFRLLSLPDAPWLDTTGAAALLDVPPDAAEELAAALTAAALLETPGPARHRHHDLLKHFARRQSERVDSPPVRDAALLRLLGHHLATAVTALRLVRPDSPVPRHLHEPGTPGRALPDAAAARDWTRDAHPHLLATVDQALRLDLPGGVRSAVDLLTAWAELVQGTARHQELEPTARQALERARKERDDVAAARALRLLGTPHFGPDTYERAETELRAGLALAESAGDALVLTMGSYELGLVLLAMGHPGEALPLLTRAEERLRAEGAASRAAEALAHAARAHLDLGATEEAMAASAAATDRARELGHVPTLVDVLHEAGRVLMRADRPAGAAERLREALALEPEPADPRRQALLWARLAHCRIRQRQHREAAADAERALEIEAELGDTYCRGLALAARGRALLALGEPRVALGALREAYEVLVRRGAAEAADVRALLDEEFPGERDTRV
ncbi:BTAD domain-containing putative transcriptional regulator [Streptomyces sp. NPDC049577]|uniref:AfsR/SARP family transcriptional regulator n=1 Tax=Streptomyces sp. NPDC049577 TaxID=3155153 RepID=UPI00342D679E